MWINQLITVRAVPMAKKPMVRMGQKLWCYGFEAPLKLGYDKKQPYNYGYPLVNSHITMERSTIFNR